MVRCPRCHGDRFRIHGVGYSGWWGQKGLFGLFGPWVPKNRTVALECSCLDCLCAFVSTPQGETESPIQAAHEALVKAQEALGKGRSVTQRQAEEPKVVPMPRPAPDPRVKRR